MKFYLEERLTQETNEEFSKLFPLTSNVLKEKSNKPGVFPLILESFNSFLYKLYKDLSLQEKTLRNFNKLDLIFSSMLSDKDLSLNFISNLLNYDNNKFKDMILYYLEKESSFSYTEFNLISSNKLISQLNSLKDKDDFISFLNKADRYAVFDILKELPDNIDKRKLDALVVNLFSLSSGNIDLILNTYGFIYFCKDELKDLIEVLCSSYISEDEMVNKFIFTINLAKNIYFLDPQKAKNFIKDEAIPRLQRQDPLTYSRNLSINSTAHGEISVRSPKDVLYPPGLFPSQSTSIFNLPFYPWPSTSLHRITPSNYPTKVYYYDSSNIKDVLRHTAIYYSSRDKLVENFYSQFVPVYSLINYLSSYDSYYNDLLSVYQQIISDKSNFNPRLIEVDSALAYSSQKADGDKSTSINFGSLGSIKENEHRYITLAGQAIEEKISAGIEGKNLKYDLLTFHSFLTNYFREQNLEQFLLTSADFNYTEISQQLKDYAEKNNLPFIFVPVSKENIPAPATASLDKSNIAIYGLVQTSQEDDKSVKFSNFGAYIKIGDHWFHVVSRENYNSDNEKLSNYFAEWSRFGKNFSLMAGVQFLGGVYKTESGEKEVDLTPKGFPRAFFVGAYIDEINFGTFSAYDPLNNFVLSLSKKFSNSAITIFNFYNINDFITSNPMFYEPIDLSKLEKDQENKNFLSLLHLLNNKKYWYAYLSFSPKKEELLGVGVSSNKLFEGSIVSFSYDKNNNEITLFGNYSHDKFSSTFSLRYDDFEKSRIGLSISVPLSYVSKDGSIITFSANYPLSSNSLVYFSKDFSEFLAQVELFEKQKQLMTETALIDQLNSLSIALANSINRLFNWGVYSSSYPISIVIRTPKGEITSLSLSLDENKKPILEGFINSEKFGLFFRASPTHDIKNDFAAGFRIDNFAIIGYRRQEEMGFQTSISIQKEDLPSSLQNAGVDTLGATVGASYKDSNLTEVHVNVYSSLATDTSGKNKIFISGNAFLKPEEGGNPSIFGLSGLVGLKYHPNLNNILEVYGKYTQFGPTEGDKWRGQEFEISSRYTADQFSFEGSLKLIGFITSNNNHFGHFSGRFSVRYRF